MTLLIRMAWRNVWRNKRRTIFTILAITFATFLTIFQRGLAVGIWEYNLKNTLELFSGYLQVQRAGYDRNPSLSLSFPYPGAVKEILDREPRITGAAPRILSEGLISFRDNSSGAALFGVDLASENKISRLAGRLDRGEFFDPARGYEVVLGHKLLANLQANIGDTLVILAQGYDGVLGNLLFRITGSLKVGVPEMDQMAVFMDLRAAEDLLAMEGRVNVVAVGLGSLYDVPHVHRTLRAALASAVEADDVVVLTWEEVLPELKQAMDFDAIGDWIFLTILMVIVAFGILNTLLMSVTERFREFGVTLAVGMLPLKLVGLVLLETAFITMIGVAIGSGIGQAINHYIAANPIPLGGEFADIYAEYGFLPLIVTSQKITIIVIAALWIVGISFLAALYPAYKVSRLEPLKGIRYT